MPTYKHTLLAAVAAAALTASCWTAQAAPWIGTSTASNSPGAALAANGIATGPASNLSNVSSSAMTSAVTSAAAVPTAAAANIVAPSARPAPGTLPVMLGSALPAPNPLQVIGVAQSVQPVQFDVVLPLNNGAGLAPLLVQMNTPGSSNFHKWLTPAAFAAEFGPSSWSMNQAAAVLRQYGFTVTPQARSLHVSGTAAQVNTSLGVALQVAQDPVGRTRLVASGPLAPTPALANLGIIVPAFHIGSTDAKPMVLRSAAGYVLRAASGYQARGGANSYFFNDLKQAYAYPSYQAASPTGAAHLDGTGATIAVIMASDVQNSDVQAMFDTDGWQAKSGQGADPAIFARRPVNGGPTATFDATSSEEATLDVEQVLGGAPGSHVVLYDTPDLSDQSLVSALVAVDNDNVADVVSMSYGQCELYYTAAYNNGVDQTALLRLYSELYEQGNIQGITFVGAAGDSGGLGCMSASYFTGAGGAFVPGLSVPAADPHVTARGGTTLMTAAAAGGTDSSYLRENAFGDLEPSLDPFGTGNVVSGGVFGSGGGVSTLYAKPAYQNLVSTGSNSFRTLPDIGMEVGGCPDFGLGACDTLGLMVGDTGERSDVAIVYNGTADTVIGTSVAAPEMASVVALMVETQGRQGNINPSLYSMAQRQAGGGAAYFHQTVTGNDGVMVNSGTYNYTTGNGTPLVANLLGLSSSPLAGAPGTATNP